MIAKKARIVIEGSLIERRLGIIICAQYKHYNICGVGVQESSEGTENKKGFAIRKDDPEFKALLDKALDEIEASGELKALKEKWGLL